MKKYNYLLLDNDGTLMDFDEAQKVAFYETYRRSGLISQREYDQSLLLCYAKNNHNWWTKLENGECTKDELQLSRFADFLTEAKLFGNPQMINEIYMDELSKGTQLIEHAAEVVKKLSQQYKIYIITNGVSSTQHRRIDACDFYPYITDIYVSEEAGAAKPSVKYFNYVFEKSKIADKSRCLVIGDSLSSDILGANNSGIDCVWYNPKKILQNQCHVDYEIHNLLELLKIL